MADYRKLALDAILADETIDDAEIKLLKKHLGELTGDSLEFLKELRAAGKKKGKTMPVALDKLIIGAIAPSLVNNGAPSADAVDTIKKIFLGKAGYDVAELTKFMKKLKKDVTSPTDAFTKFIDGELAKLEPAKTA